MKRLALALLFCAGTVILGEAALDRWVSTAALPPLMPEVSTVVEARDGQLLRAFTVADGRWRLPVELSEVSRGYLDQLIAFEDKRFYSHAGVDPVAMIRAAGQALRNGRLISGGSTLTMQVARLLEDSGTGAWRGKLRQIRVALALERRATKDEILTLYLTLAPFGGNIEGVRAASLVYFRKEPARLTEAESALLVALPQSPERRRPDRHAKAARAARDRVLARSAGAGVLSADAARAARRDPVPDRRHAFPTLAPHLAERMVAEDALPLRHRTTLDRALQRRAEELARAHVRGKHAALSAAIIVAENDTGAVRAAVGSPDYLSGARQGFVDMTRATRSPGSTLKPLVYGLAFEAGKAHPETLIEDAPIRFGAYAPQNFDSMFRGQIRVREALQMSLNLPAVQLLEAVGPGVLMARMRRAGADPRLPTGQPGLAVALGGVGLTLRDLVSIYAAFPRGGLALTLTERAGSDTAARGRRVLSPLAAWYVGDILAGVPPPRGAAKGIAYKTGTSYGHRDAWAIGFDGAHTVGVWLGRADGAAMPGELGADLAAPLLFDVFAALGAPHPLPQPPAQALTVSTAALPPPLRRFRRPGMIGPARNAPEITFPPAGARVHVGSDPLVFKIARGVPPFTYLADGRPVAIGSFDRIAEIRLDRAGPVVLSVIDATGASQRVEVVVERQRPQRQPAIRSPR